MATMELINDLYTTYNTDTPVELFIRVCLSGIADQLCYNGINEETRQYGHSILTIFHYVNIRNRMYNESVMRIQHELLDEEDMMTTMDPPMETGMNYLIMNDDSDPQPV